MKIIDVDGNEISKDNVDYEAGELVTDYVFVAEHPGVPEIPESGHTEYTVEYMDGTKHKFDHMPQPQDYLKDKDVVSESEEYVIDQEYVPAIDPWTENEEVLRYVLFSEEQLAEIQAQKDALAKAEEDKKKQERWMEDVQLSIDDTMLILADLIGGIY